MILEPAYDASLHRYDAALLVLSVPTTAPALGLPTSADQYMEQGGTSAWVAGWGETYPGSGPTTALRWAHTVVQSPGYCTQFSSAYSSSSDLCSVNPPSYDTSTCHGDSGGPLFAPAATGQLVELGITSYGPNACSTNTPAYFTALLPIRPWIDQEIAANTPAPPPAPGNPPPTPPAATPPPASAPARHATPASSSPPASTTPLSSLPTLTILVARGHVRQILTGVFGRIFSRGSEGQSSCSRLSSVKVSCGIGFSSGSNDYYGNITVRYRHGLGGNVAWTDNYAVRRVNHRCYYHSGHPRRCSVHVRQGSW